jgi:hypothetical protein
MGYFGDMYGKRSKEFIDGVIAGMTAHAVWKDGKQWVGSPGKTLEKAIVEVKADLGYPKEKGGD